MLRCARAPECVTLALALLFVGDRRPGGRERRGKGSESESVAAAAAAVAPRPRPPPFSLSPSLMFPPRPTLTNHTHQTKARGPETTQAHSHAPQLTRAARAHTHAKRREVGAFRFTEKRAEKREREASVRSRCPLARPGCASNGPADPVANTTSRVSIAAGNFQAGYTHTQARARELLCATKIVFVFFGCCFFAFGRRPPLSSFFELTRPRAPLPPPNNKNNNTDIHT
jgi:hypothetical protein